MWMFLVIAMIAAVSPDMRGLARARHHDQLPDPPTDDHVAWRISRGADPSARHCAKRPATKRSRNAVFLNLPVAVRGIASMNSIRSGSCHLANSPPRCSRSSSGLACMPSRSTTAASGRSPHFSSGTRDHRSLRDGAMSHQLVLEVDRGDPFATGFDEVLGPVADAHAAALVDADDVAGAKPAVIGELVGARSADGRPPRPTGRGSRALPSPGRPTGSASPSSPRARISMSGIGVPWRARYSYCSRGVSASRSAGSFDNVPSGEVSVMPQPWMIVKP